MTRQIAAINAGRGGNDAAGRPVPPQGPYWDLDLLTPDDVCALLKVKKSWLYDAVESGALEAVRLGKQLRFRPSALARYLFSVSLRERVRADRRDHKGLQILSQDRPSCRKIVGRRTDRRADD